MVDSKGMRLCDVTAMVRDAPSTGSRRHPDAGADPKRAAQVSTGLATWQLHSGAGAGFIDPTEAET